MYMVAWWYCNLNYWGQAATTMDCNAQRNINNDNAFPETTEALHYNNNNTRNQSVIYIL